MDGIGSEGNVPSQPLGLLGDLELNPLSLCDGVGLSVTGRNIRNIWSEGN
jgi:hypothetical protein